MKNYSIKTFIYLLIIVLSFSSSSCDEWIEIDDPKGEINSNLVYDNPITANASITSIYKNLKNSSLTSGASNGNGVIFGLYADELDYFGNTGIDIFLFYNHLQSQTTAQINSIWSNNYKIIYQANDAIEKLNQNNSELINTDLKNKLLAEAFFIRAFTHFNLVNAFGDIPYIKTTNYNDNKNVNRDPVHIVYQEIINDLVMAKNLALTNQSLENNRANKYSISTLLSKVYLFNEEWSKAIQEANEVINSGVFYFNPEIENQYLVNSPSSIFVYSPIINGDNTNEASYSFYTVGPPVIALTNQLVNSFPDGDSRKEKWIKQIFNSNQSQSWYISYKYKEKYNTGVTKENSVVLGLSELILIRAEAYLHTNNYNLALQDINTIRIKANLNPFFSNNHSEIFNELVTQKKLELFTEQGIRWFDLKRWGMTNEIIQSIKPNWKPHHILLPLPENELLINPNLYPQNYGY